MEIGQAKQLKKIIFILLPQDCDHVIENKVQTSSNYTYSF